jgi:hypothetical protein
MTRHDITADQLADQGSALGVGLWTALQAVTLNNRRDAFESALQLIAQSVAGREQSNLIEASAMLALIDQFPTREFSIRGEAEDAYMEYLMLIRAEEAADIARSALEAKS